MSKEEFDLIQPHLPVSGRLLEIGSYPFERTKDLIELGYDVSGVDLNHNKTEYHVKKCDIETEKLPYNDNEFDIVLMMQVLEHLGRDPIWPLKEIKRVLKKDSMFLLSTPNFYHLRNFYYIIFKGYQWEISNFVKYTGRQDYTGHIRTYSRKEIKMLLESCEFNVKEHHYLWYSSEKYKIGGIITYLLPFFRDHHLFISEVSE